MPNTLKFLMSKEAAYQRMLKRKPAFVVHIRTENLEHFIELDADSPEQGEIIAKNWVTNMGKTSASIRRVFYDGTLAEPFKEITS